MIAFFCATPYQILIAIQIKTALYQDEAADLYILNHFKNSKEIAQNLALQHVFQSVKEVYSSLAFTQSISRKSRSRHFLKFFSYYNYKRYASQFFGIREQIYDDVFFSYADVIIQLGLKKILLNNKNCKIHLFEDGVGGYLSFGTKINQKKKIYNLLTFSKGLENYVDLYAFAPNLMYKTNLPVIKIPNINPNNLSFNRLLNQIFGFNSESISSKYILLEQPLNFQPKINDIQLSFFNEVKLYDHIVKMHPRSNAGKYENFNIYRNSEIPWEIICLNSNLDDKVLITFYSTAAITGKIIFDIETPIIFLYRIDQFKKHYDASPDLNIFLEKFKENCRNQEKIFFPDNLTEFKQILNSLKNS